VTELNFDQLRALAPNIALAKDQYASAFQAPLVADILTKYEINRNALRVCHFLAQIFTETGALTTLVENLNYSASRLTQVWPARFPTMAAAAPYAHHAEKLANFVYGGRMGNTNPGDGFLYRGRGLLQITGKNAYARIGGKLGFDLAGDPDQAFGAAHCLEVAAAEWAASGWNGRSCNALADADDVVGVTRAINGGLNGIQDRRAWLAKAKSIWLAPPPALAQLSSRAIANLDGADFAAGAAASPEILSAATFGASQPFDPVKATMLGQFVAAAYAMYDGDPNNLMPTQPASFPPLYRLAASIHMQDFVLTSTGPVFYGFVAQSTANPNEFVLAIRGTSNWVEWWDDANSGSMQPFKVPGCGSVGDGFARIYDTIEVVEYPAAAPMAAGAPKSLKSAGGFSQQIAALVTRHAPAPTAAFARSAVVSVAGHSMGAALATLYALDNAKTDQIRNPLVCTFASPRVGDNAFAQAFNNLGLTSWRIENSPDLVPKLPPQFLGFEHVDALVPVSSSGKVKISIACWHALATYLSLIDPSLQPDPDCRLAPQGASALLRTAPFVGKSISATSQAVATGARGAALSRGADRAPAQPP
jgi:predicted chitinase